MRDQQSTEIPEDVELTLQIDKMIAENKFKYLAVNLLARRCRDLTDGARPLVKMDGPHTPLETAMAEALAGTLKIERKQKERVIVDLVENN